MYLTSREVISEYKKYKRVGKIYVKEVKIQRKEEHEIMMHEKQWDCDPIVTLNINKNKLASLVKDSYSNRQIMETESCVLNNYIGYSLDVNDGNLGVSDRVSDLIMDGKIIGEESVSGYASIFHVKDSGITIIVKSPRHEGDEDDFTHELFVARHGTNNLREYIPNFAYVYGGFKCGPPSFDSEGKVNNYCDKDSKVKVDYLMYEYIDGKVGNDFLKTCDEKDFISMILQIAMATKYGHSKIDWTHYDLHPGNVIMRAIGEEKNIIYPVGSHSDEYNLIKSKYVATIIDYGRSHIVYEGKNYGYDFKGAGISAVESFPISDVYKFLMFSIRSLEQEGRFDIMDGAAATFFSYFSTEDIQKASVDQYKSYYVLPKTETTKDMNIDDFINHFMDAYEDSDSYLSYSKIKNLHLQNTDLFGCPGDICYTKKEINKKIRGNHEIESYVDYYDKMKIIQKTGNKIEIEKWKRAFGESIELLCTNHTNMLNDTIDKYNYVFSSTKDIFSKNKKSEHLNKLKFLYHKIIRYLKIAQSIEDSFGYTCNDVKLQIVKWEGKIKLKLNEFVDNYNHRVVNIKTYFSRKDETEYPQKSSDKYFEAYNWYVNFMGYIPNVGQNN